MRSITILRGSTDVTILRYITSAAGYTLRPAAVVVIIDILLRRRKSAVILWIPVVLIGIIAFTSYYTHLIMLVILYIETYRRDPLTRAHEQKELLPGRRQIPQQEYCRHIHRSEWS